MDKTGSSIGSSIGNIDYDEVDMFDDLAAEWWDPDGPFKTLHELTPLRLEYVASKGDLRGKRVLDVGCGGGILSEAMAARGAEVTGLDVAPAVISVAKSHAETRRLTIDYLEVTVEELADNGVEPFDLITCMEMLEHVPARDSVIDACARLVKPGGDLVLSSINRTPKAFLLAIVSAEYVLNLLPRGTHRYDQLIRPSEIARWVRESGLTTHEIRGYTYNPVTSRFSLSSNSDVNYFLHARRDA